MMTEQRPDSSWFYLIILIYVSILVSVFSSCREVRYVPSTNEILTVEKETLVPVPMPVDSASVRAWLECDERGKVVMQWLEVEQGKNIQLQFTIDSMGVVISKMRTVKDTVYIPSKEIVREKRVEVPYPVEKKLTQSQKLYISLGKFFSVSIVISLSYLIVWLIIKTRNK